MSGCLLMSKIKEKYKGEWVFLVECERTENGDIKKGKVILHSPNRDEVYRNLTKLKSQKGMTLLRYLGEIPKDLTVMLWV